MMPRAASSSTIARSFEQTVARALRDQCLSAAERATARLPLLVAVSGGADSLALLHGLARLRPPAGRRGLPPLALHAAYIDHGLRPAPVTAAEAAFVAAEATRLGATFRSARVDTAATARQEQRSIEDAARRGRYAALALIAADVGATLVATGHTADDRAETVLLRLLRGTGVEGLAVLPPRAPWPSGDTAPTTRPRHADASVGPRLPWPPAGSGLAVIRPLLSLSHADTVAYCAALGLAPLHDAENDNPRYTRNRVRHELLPLLRRFNPRVTPALNALADDAAAVRELIAVTLAPLWPTLATVAPGRIRLDRAALRAQPIALQMAALRQAYALLSADGLPPDRRTATALLRLLAAGAGRSLDLAGVTVSSTHDALWLTATAPAAIAGASGEQPSSASARGGPARLAASGAPPPPTPVTLPSPGSVRYGVWRVTVAGPLPAVIDHADRFTAWLQPELFAAAVTVGARRPGERIAPLGMTGTRTVQDVLVDAHVPRAERDAVPIVRMDERVAWVVGHRLAGWAAAPAGAPAIRVRFTRLDDAR